MIDQCINQTFVLININALVSPEDKNEQILNSGCQMQVCYCGNWQNGRCESLPFACWQNYQYNQRSLFYENQFAAWMNWQAPMEKYMEKTLLLFPACGTTDDKGIKFAGRCMVCRFEFQDYIIHVATFLHKQKIRQCPFEEDIADLCKIFDKNQIAPRVRRQGRFCKKNGTTRKHKFKQDQKNGRFVKSS